jgi:hypothetical protein
MLQLVVSVIHSRRLRRLSIGSNKLRRDGGIALARALWEHPTIESLDLSHNQIHNEGAIAFRDLLLRNNKLHR